jgi:hypothetical protein
MPRHLIAGAGLIVAAVLTMLAGARADELPVFRIDLQDGLITPSRIEVPAHTRFKLELHNTGTTPVEFESLELRKEKVLGPGAQSFIVIRRLARASTVSSTNSIRGPARRSWWRDRGSSGITCRARSHRSPSSSVVRASRHCSSSAS